ncbi:MAG: transglycosylase domain-containing protein [Mogibacterium sp.]|nr:transglycosylase domain-containing protein [Mogibacterium sp.]
MNKKSNLKNKKKYNNPKGRRRKKRKSWAFFKAFFVTLFFTGIFICGGIVYYGWTIIQNAPPIEPKSIYEKLEVSSQIYDDKGRLFDEIYYDENRKIIKYEQIPDNLKNAFIAVEDKTFWEHKGFNFRRIFGAIYDALNGGRIGGTSTISQQLARNIFLPESKEDRTIERKLTEMYYAFEIENELSKEEILTAYLNTIYLGYNCYGIDTASRKYFSTEVGELSLEQCAALAALPQAPGEYALLVGDEGEKTVELSKGLYVNDLSEDRRNMVLDLMAEQDMVTQEEADAAKKPAAEFINPGKESAFAQSAFKDYLISRVITDLAAEYELTDEQAESMVYTKGLRIYSTLDTQAQGVITREFKDGENFPDAAGDADVEAAMVICENATGQVKAMVGGRSGKGQMLFNRATSPRQPGSSIKPVSVYAPALQKSLEYAAKGKKFPFVKTGYEKQGKKGYGDYITASSKVVDEKMVVKGEVWPLNFSRSYSGKKTLRTALQLSLNTCAVKLLTQVSIEYSMEMMHKFGVTTVIDDYEEAYNDINLAALGLGAMTEGVTPLDMSLAYATFPNGGVRYSPVCYTRVEDSDGNIILEGKTEETRVLDEGVAWIMTDLLRSVVSEGIAGDAKIEGEMPGGKTGTTNDNYDIWFDGFTPNCSASLWIGTDENITMYAESSKAAALWSRIMSQVEIARGGQYKAMPANVVKKKGEYYTRGTEPKEKKKSDKKKKDDESAGAETGE